MIHCATTVVKNNPKPKIRYFEVVQYKIENSPSSLSCSCHCCPCGSPPCSRAHPQLRGSGVWLWHTLPCRSMESSGVGGFQSLRYLQSQIIDHIKGEQNKTSLNVSINIFGKNCGKWNWKCISLFSMSTRLKSPIGAEIFIF